MNIKQTWIAASNFECLVKFSSVSVAVMDEYKGKMDKDGTQAKVISELVWTLE